MPRRNRTARRPSQRRREPLRTIAEREVSLEGLAHGLVRRGLAPRLILDTWKPPKPRPDQGGGPVKSSQPRRPDRRPQAVSVSELTQPHANRR